MTFTAELLLLLLVLASFLLNGIAPLRIFTTLRGIELIGYGAAVGGSLHGLFRGAIAAAPRARGSFIVVLVALTFASAGYRVWRPVLPKLWNQLSGPVKHALCGWVLLL